MLGAILRQNELITEAAALVDVGDFGLESHRRIFATMLDEIVDGHPVDIASLAAALGKRQQLAIIGGVSYLSELTDLAITVPSHVRHHSKVIRDKSLLRHVARLAEATAAAAQEPNQKAERVIANLSDQLLTLTQANRAMSVRTAKQIMHDVCDEMCVQRRHDGLVGLPTGLPSLDDKTGGIRPGELWVIGALPSRGKTALGVQIGAANVRSGNPTLVFSLEMTGNQVGRRLLANFSGVEANKVRNPRYIRDDEWNQMEESAAEISDWPLWVDDASSLTTAQLATRARVFIRRHGVKLVIVDYLMLIQEPREREQRLKAERIANTLRCVAKDEGVAVIVLSQLRKLSGGINAVPDMNDLKESGNIAADAHVILLIYMPIGDNHQPTGEEEIIIGKQREGWLGALPVYYNRKRLLFEDRVPTDKRDSKRAAAGDRA